MSNAEPDPSRPNGAASGSLGAMYETAVRHTIAMPNVAGTSIGSAYESWFEADQEAQWLRNLESTRSHASSDHTQVIDLGEVDAYRERREAEDAWNLEADDALAVSGRPGAQRLVFHVKHEARGRPPSRRRGPQARRPTPSRRPPTAPRPQRRSPREQAGFCATAPSWRPARSSHACWACSVPC